MTVAVAALAVTSGCQMLPEGGEEGKGGEEQRHPDDQNYWRPGDPPPNGGVPVVRKLALDLTGVAGFAIVNPEGDSESGDAGGTRTLSRRSVGALEKSGSTLWLSSSSAGSVILAAQESTDTPSTDAADPGAGSDGAAPGADGSGTATDSGDTTTSSGAGEQAGLFKITQEGELLPAIVALEEEPVADESEPPAGSAGQDPGGNTGEDPGPGGAFADAGAAPPEPGPGGEQQVDPTAPPPPPPQHHEPLPRVTAVGLSPDGSVYVLFEHGFMFRQPTEEEMRSGADVFGPSSPYRCQLFRADGSWQGAASLAELECVTQGYEIRTWDTRRVMQFDMNGKLYFRASTPGTPREIFYQYDPATGGLTEKVNGNICWRDVQVTPRGSLFYTGISNGDNGDCTGTSFFRYVSAENRLTEIARDWWDFKYLAEQDPDDPANERIIFYGPDPNATTLSGWESACLYRYNPAAAEPAARTEKLIDCISDPSRYINGGSNMGAVSAEELPGYVERCQSEGQLFVGGQGVSGLSQLKDGTLFVVGEFQKKVAGQASCWLEVTGPHCDSLDAEHASREACEGAGHAWFDSGYCGEPAYASESACIEAGATWYPGGNIFQHYQRTGAGCLVSGEGVTVQSVQCMPQGTSGYSQFSETVDGLAYLRPPTSGEGLAELELLSDPGEEVERYWALEGEEGPELYYSVYSGGQYNLRLVTQGEDAEGNPEVQRRLVLEDYEVYNLQRDPGDPNRVMFDALQFSTNQYVFGSADTSLPTAEEVQASVEAVAGMSGRVETLIVLPNF